MVSLRTVLVAICFLLLCSFGSGKFDYIFRISTSQSTNNLPKDITVEIINNENSPIKLNNLIFDFYIGDDGYWATSDKARFLEQALTLQSKAHFKQTISIDSFTFSRFDNSQSISTTEVKTKLKNSKAVRVVATISDIRILENPLASSSLTHSNIIELQVK